MQSNSNSFIPTILHSSNLQLTVSLHKMSLASQLTKKLFILTISFELHFVLGECKISFNSFLHHISTLHKIMNRKGSSQVRPLLPPPFCHISNQNHNIHVTTIITSIYITCLQHLQTLLDLFLQ